MNELAVGVRRDEQEVVGLSAFHKALGQTESIHKAGATEAEVHRAATGLEPQTMLEQARRGGQKVIRALRAVEKVVNVLTAANAGIKELAGSQDREIGRALVLGGDMTFADARLGEDFIGRPVAELLGELLVAEHLGGQRVFDCAEGCVHKSGKVNAACNRHPQPTWLPSSNGSRPPEGKRGPPEVAPPTLVWPPPAQEH